MAVSQNSTITADDFNKWTVQFSTYRQQLSGIVSASENESDTDEDDGSSTYPTTVMTNVTLAKKKATTYYITRPVPSGYTETGLVRSLNTGSTRVAIRRLTMSKVCLVNVSDVDQNISSFYMDRSCHRTGIYLSSAASRVSAGDTIKAAHINGLGVQFRYYNITVSSSSLTPTTGGYWAGTAMCLDSDESLVGIAGFDTGQKQLAINRMESSQTGKELRCVIGVVNIDQRGGSTGVTSDSIVVRLVTCRVTFSATTAYRTRVSTTDADPKIKPSALNNITLNIIRTTQYSADQTYGVNQGYSKSILSTIQSYNTNNSSLMPYATDLKAMYGFNSHYKWLLPRYIKPWHSDNGTPNPNVYFTNASTTATLTNYHISVCLVYCYLS